MYSDMVDHNQGTTDMPDLESAGSVAQRNNQARQGIKILTLYQMLSRLTTTLPQ